MRSLSQHLIYNRLYYQSQESSQTALQLHWFLYSLFKNCDQISSIRTSKRSPIYCHRKGNRSCGVTYFMGLKKLPALTDYWRTDELRVPFAIDSISRDRYNGIRKNLYFSNNLDSPRTDDKAVKVRQLIEHYNIVYQRKATNVSHYSTDEHMVKFKGHRRVKQYVKNKHIKWVFKFWVRCDAINGYIYEFEIYTGQKDAPELDLGENVVLDLTKKLHGTGISIFADNYFSSPTLASLLPDWGMNFVGVVRKDKKCLPSLKDDKKIERWEWNVLLQGRKLDGCKMDWQQINVYNFQHNQFRHVKYNKNMGGVDIRCGTVRQEIGRDTIISLWFLKTIR